MKGTKLTATFYVGGKQVDKLTDEQRERIAQKFSEVTSAYYTAHPEEYKQLKRTELQLKKN